MVPPCASSASALNCILPLRSVDAKALEPGRYTVILEPAATSELLGFMLSGFDARQTDEGPDITWAQELAHFERLCDAGATDLSTDWWIAQTLLRAEAELAADGSLAGLG